MADKTYYAWGPILYGTEVDKTSGVINHRKDKYVKVGEAVSASDLGIDDEEFAALIESGAVRTQKYPDNIPEGYQGSPVDWLKKQAQDAANEAIAGVQSLQTNADEPQLNESTKTVEEGDDKTPPSSPTQAAPLS